MASKVSSLVAKLETEVHIKASAEEFYHLFARRPYLVSHISQGIIQGVDLVDGEWGTIDSIVVWNYIHDGKAKATKVIIEAVEPEKNLASFRAIEGDLMEDFKSIVSTFQVTAKPKEPGSIVQWKLEYEKISEEVPHLETFIQMADVLSKEIDKQLLSGQ